MADVLATPVPKSGTAVGLPTALLGMLTFADFAPALRGSNFTLIAQVPLDATVVQVLPEIANDGTFAPTSVGVPTVSDTVPVFITVIVCAALAVPTP